MKSMPRLLPLVAVSIGGVLAIKALSGVQALPDMLAAGAAHAEGAPAHGHAAPASAPLPSTLAVAPPPRPAPACAVSPAELAREAGLSAGELQTLQNLQSRRGQLDDREKTLDTQIQLLAAAETKLDARLASMNAVKAQIQGLLGQADQQQQADVDRLTSVYQKMKPADAAAVMATLDDKVRIPVAAKMKDSNLAAILAKMPTVEAKKLTESLAERAANAHAAIQAAEQAPATAVAAASPDPTQPTPAPAKPRAHPRHVGTAQRKTAHAAAAQDLLAAASVPARTVATPATPAPLAAAKPVLPPVKTPVPAPAVAAAPKAG